MFTKRPLTGRNHPVTSYQAAQLVMPRAGSQRARIVELLRTYDATTEEISEALELRIQSAGPRRLELEAEGWLEDSGQRRPTSSGADAIVYRLTAAARAWLDQHDQL
jgi:MoxR-like ATPase